MSTYVAATLGCLTAMALVAYGKELRRRWRCREPLFGKKDRYYWDDF